MYTRNTSSHREVVLGYHKLPSSGTKCVSIGQKNWGMRVERVLTNSPPLLRYNERKPRVDGTEVDGCLLCITLNNWLVPTKSILCDP